MQKEGGAGKKSSIPSGWGWGAVGGEGAEQVHANRTIDWRISLGSFVFSIETNSLAVLEW